MDAPTAKTPPPGETPSGPYRGPAERIPYCIANVGMSIPHERTHADAHPLNPEPMQLIEGTTNAWECPSCGKRVVIQ